MNDIIYIATDRAYAGKFRLYGGYNVYPNLKRMSDHGALYRNATAAAGSTLMCHASEWTGRYTWDLHKDIPYKKRVYSVPIPYQDSVFTDLEKLGYDSYIILVKKRQGKCYDSFKPVFDLWPKSVNLRILYDWDTPEGAGNTRRTQFEEIIKCLDSSKKRNRKAFIWLKCHGFYQWEQRAKYLNYAGQRRVNKEDIYNAEIDDNIGFLLDEIDFKNPTAPEIWFASDHGSWLGEDLRAWYGYHLNQEIVHVPLIRSKGGGTVIDTVFSMRKIRAMLNGDHNIGEEFIYAETLYPGQFSKNHSSGTFSLAKIMVRMGRYKYIYSRFGKDGTSDEPLEELYDVAYDPAEKFNMSLVFTKKYQDQARSGLTGKPLTQILSRINSNDIITKSTSTFNGQMPENEIFLNSLNECGWEEIQGILIKLRTQAKTIWEKTGREAKFVI